MKNYLYYIDLFEFFGSYEYDEELDIFHGRIEGISDLITFESDKNIEMAFREACREYVDFMIKHGLKIEQNFTIKELCENEFWSIGIIPMRNGLERCFWSILDKNKHSIIRGFRPNYDAATEQAKLCWEAIEHMKRK